MNKYLGIVFFITTFSLLLSQPDAYAQNRGLDAIRQAKLKATIEFLASNAMQGRKTGDVTNEITARYLASEAEKLGLKPLVDSSGFLQTFILDKTSLRTDSSWIQVSCLGSVKPPMDRGLVVFPVPAKNVSLDAPVVFAGYGINSPADNYNDLKGIDGKDKIILFMDRAPSSPDGKKCLLKDSTWMKQFGVQKKIAFLFAMRPKAVMIAIDPKSGYSSLEEVMPGLTRYLAEQYSLAGSPSMNDILRGNMPKILLITRAMADSILAGAKTNLRDLQLDIDRDLKPRSFDVPDTRVKVNLCVDKKQVNAYNVAGMIQGTDPVLKNEAVIYTAHFDHIGVDPSGKVNRGADDNASGTAALLEVARAFKAEQKSLKRSVIILWVNSEELGLLGSKYYADHPEFPLEKTVADINLDMIGRSRTPVDTGMYKGEKLDVKAGDSVFVTTGRTSTELMALNDRISKKMGMVSDYAYNSPNDPGQMFSRSDQFSFAQKKVPVIFYTTGAHRDYHSPQDIPSKLNYAKMEKVARLAYRVGYQLAVQKTRPAYDK